MLAWTLAVTWMSATTTTIVATAKFSRTMSTTTTVTTTSNVMGKLNPLVMFIIQVMIVS